MPRQNRVTPSGEIVAVAERGTMMGNRGVLHNNTGRIVRPWQVTRWIVCLLEFKGRKQPVMSPGIYTQLFFLDEATALAAGHRPCSQCRHDRFKAFRSALVVCGLDSVPGTAPQIDSRLHSERLCPEGTKQTFTAKLDTLPDGVFVRLPERDDVAWLVRGDLLLFWSASGYQERSAHPKGIEVMVLTPPSTVAAIRAGYAPLIHASAG